MGRDGPRPTVIFRKRAWCVILLHLRGKMDPNLQNVVVIQWGFVTTPPDLRYCVRTHAKLQVCNKDMAFMLVVHTRLFRPKKTWKKRRILHFFLFCVRERACVYLCGWQIVYSVCVCERRTREKSRVTKCRLCQDEARKGDIKDQRKRESASGFVWTTEGEIAWERKRMQVNVNVRVRMRGLRHVRMRVWKCVYVCVCVCVYLTVCPYVYVCVFVCVCVVCLYVLVRVYVCACVCVRASVCISCVCERRDEGKERERERKRKEKCACSCTFVTVGECFNTQSVVCNCTSNTTFLIVHTLHEGDILFNLQIVFCFCV